MGLHKKSKGVKKFKTHSFYLDLNTLKKLDFISEFEGQSRSIIVELCLKLYFKGANYETNQIKSRLYAKKKKKIRFSKNNHHHAQKTGKKAGYEPQLPFK